MPEVWAHALYGLQMKPTEQQKICDAFKIQLENIRGESIETSHTGCNNCQLDGGAFCDWGDRELQLMTEAKLMTPLEKMKIIAPSLNVAYERLNARIEELEREIAETGLNVGDAYLPLKYAEGTFLTWTKHSGAWRLCVVFQQLGRDDEITPLTSAPREARLEAIQRIGEFHARMVDRAEKIQVEMQEASE